MRWFMDKSRAMKAAMFPPLPPALGWFMASVWISVGIMVLGMLAVGVVTVTVPAARSLRQQFGWAEWVPMVLFVVGCGWAGIRRMRVRRAYDAAGGVLCAACLHPMAGLEDQGRCPECGRRFEPEFDAPLWENAGIRPKRADKPKP